MPLFQGTHAPRVWEERKTDKVTSSQSRSFTIPRELRDLQSHLQEVTREPSFLVHGRLAGEKKEEGKASRHWDYYTYNKNVFRKLIIVNSVKCSKCLGQGLCPGNWLS